MEALLAARTLQLKQKGISSPKHVRLPTTPHTRRLYAPRRGFCSELTPVRHPPPCLWFPLQRRERSYLDIRTSYCRRRWRVRLETEEAYRADGRERVFVLLFLPPPPLLGRPTSVVAPVVAPRPTTTAALQQAATRYLAHPWYSARSYTERQDRDRCAQLHSATRKFFSCRTKGRTEAKATYYNITLLPSTVVNAPSPSSSLPQQPAPGLMVLLLHRHAGAPPRTSGRAARCAPLPARGPTPPRMLASGRAARCRASAASAAQARSAPEGVPPQQADAVPLL